MNRCHLQSEPSIADLRRKLKIQNQDKAPAMLIIDTESRLVMTLARSHHLRDLLEALESGEDLWAKLGDSRGGSPISSPLPNASKTALRITLCSTMRRCALMAGKRSLAELWTKRFADRRRSIRPEDFYTPYTQGDVLGQPTGDSSQPNTGKGGRSHRAPMGSGNHFYMGDDEEDGDDDEEFEGHDRGNSTRQAAGEGGSHAAQEDKAGKGEKKQNAEHPVKRFRHEVFLDHPMIQKAFQKKPQPGPRYTG